jgi:hypothetical protein
VLNTKRGHSRALPRRAGSRFFQGFFPSVFFQFSGHTLSPSLGGGFFPWCSYPRRSFAVSSLRISSATKPIIFLSFARIRAILKSSIERREQGMLDLSVSQWILVVTAAFFVGFSKMGISGVMMLIIPILANLFGGKESTGLMLPILLTGDIIAVFITERAPN